MADRLRHRFWRAHLESLRGDQACFWALTQTTVCVTICGVGSTPETLATIGEIFDTARFFPIYVVRPNTANRTVSLPCPRHDQKPPCIFLPSLAAPSPAFPFPHRHTPRLHRQAKTWRGWRASMRAARARSVLWSKTARRMSAHISPAVACDKGEIIF